MAPFMDDKFFALTDTEEMFRLLVKRKYWKRIRPEILRHIFQNASSDILRIKPFLELSVAKRIQRFVSIAEVSHALEQNFTNLGKDSDTTQAAFHFAAVLNSYGTQTAERIPSVPSASTKANMGVLMELAFQSAILCNPFNMQSYMPLAYYYILIGRKEIASEVCQEFDRMLQLLEDTPEEDLSWANKVLKGDKGGLKSTIEKDMNEFRKEYGIISAGA